MCRDEAELERAVVVVGETVAALGLELSAEKTRVVDTYEGDFDYLSFTFRRAHTFSDGNWKYWVTPTEASLAKFKRELKSRTKKTYSKSFEQWAKALNPVLRGKFGYFLAANRAVRAVWEECRRRGMHFHGRAKRTYQQLDAYVRQRLRRTSPTGAGATPARGTPGCSRPSTATPSSWRRWASSAASTWRTCCAVPT
jgi:hypothetical protein